MLVAAGPRRLLRWWCRLLRRPRLCRLLGWPGFRRFLGFGRRRRLRITLRNAGRLRRLRILPRLPGRLGRLRQHLWWAPVGRYRISCAVTAFRSKPLMSGRHHTSCLCGRRSRALCLYPASRVENTDRGAARAALRGSAGAADVVREPRGRARDRSRGWRCWRPGPAGKSSACSASWRRLRAGERHLPEHQAAESDISGDTTDPDERVLLDGNLEKAMVEARRRDPSVIARFVV